MNLRDYVAKRMEFENTQLKNPNLRFETPSTADEIINLYRTYDGMKRHMRALSPEKVQEYIDANGVDIDIEVDGGINKDTSKLAIEAGANILVAGNYLVTAENIEEAVANLK